MSSQSPADAELQRRLVGTYRLASVESIDEDGDVQHPFGESPDGLMTYSAEGYIVTILARSDRTDFPDGDIMGGTDAERVTAFLTASAFAGHFEVLDGKVVYNLEAATFQNWKGTTQVRDFELTEDGLVLKTPFIMMSGKLRRSVVRLTRLPLGG